MPKTMQTPVDIWQGLMAAKDIVRAVKVSRAHWHSLVTAGMAPPPVLRIGKRYTRWRGADIKGWYDDPSGYIITHTKTSTLI